MARTKNARKTHRRRRHRGSKRRGQSGGASLAPLNFTEVSGADMGGAGANMLKLVGDGPTQQTGMNGAIKLQNGGARRRRQKKTKGGSLMNALSGAIVPLALFGANYKYGKRHTKKR